MRRPLAQLGLRGLCLAAALAALSCGAPGYNIGWVDSLQDVDTSSPQGTRLQYACPAGGSTTATVWGTDIYTDDSSICVAAVHAGKITTLDGGTVTVQVELGRGSYAGSTRNGVSSLSFGSFARSFTFR